MPNWIIKATAQKLLSLLPRYRQLNSLVQRHISRSVRITDFFLEDRLSHVSRHWIAARKYLQEGSPVFLELGSGWYPVVPVGLFLLGAEKVITMDTFEGLKKPQLIELQNIIKAKNTSGELKRLLPGIIPERLALFFNLNTEGTLKSCLSQLNISYMVGEMEKLPIPGKSADAFISNNTFEHISGRDLEAILRTALPLIRHGGIMSHYIDMADHYSYFDPRISPLNYLRFSENQWKWIENRIQCQNRMRLSQYLELFRRLDLEILEVEKERLEKETLNDLPLAVPYSDLPEEDLLVGYAQVVVRV